MGFKIQIKPENKEKAESFLVLKSVKIRSTIQKMTKKYPLKIKINNKYSHVYGSPI